MLRTGVSLTGAFIHRSGRKAIGIYWELFKLAFPLLIAVKVLDDAFNVVSHLGDAFSPLMNFVGLPGNTSIIFATAVLINIYAAVLLTATLWNELALSTAQATVLMTMILIAHALPVELRIVQKAGMRIVFAFLLRFLSAFVLGVALFNLYGDTWLQTPAHLSLSEPPPTTAGWTEWLSNEALNWMVIFVIVFCLVLLIDLLKITHIEHLFSALLSPVFRCIGIGEKATTIAMTGLLLGLSYGGAFLIKESHTGNLNRRDLLCVLALISLCHAVIEDTLLVMVVGAHWSGVLAGRVVFSLLFVMVFARVIHRMNDKTLNKIAPPHASA